MDCHDDIHDSLLGPQTSQVPSPAYLLYSLTALTLHPIRLCSQLWVWFPHFVWDWAIKLQHQISAWCDLGIVHSLS